MKWLCGLKMYDLQILYNVPNNRNELFIMGIFHNLTFILLQIVTKPLSNSCKFAESRHPSLFGILHKL